MPSLEQSARAFRRRVAALVPAIAVSATSAITLMASPASADVVTPHMPIITMTPANATTDDAITLTTSVSGCGPDAPQPTVLYDMVGMTSENWWYEDPGTWSNDGDTYTVSKTFPAGTFPAGTYNLRAYGRGAPCFNDLPGDDYTWSVPKDVTVSAPMTVPGTPTLVGATAGNGNAQVSWAVPDSDGGAPITDYAVRYSSDGGDTWTLVNHDPSSLTTLEVDGLTNGQTYLFQVAAINGAGTGAWSASSTTLTLPIPAVAPAAPSITSVVAGNRTATVAVAAPSTDGGAAVTGITVTANPGAITKSVPASGGSVTFTGMTNGTSYAFTAKATNAIGDSPNSAGVSATPATVPGLPYVTVKPSWYTAQIIVGAPASNGGQAILRHRVVVSGGGATARTWTVGATGGTVNVGGLKPSTAYTVLVTAENAGGSSVAAGRTLRTTALPAPVPMTDAGHKGMSPGQSATLSGTGLFPLDSAALTPAGRAQVKALVPSLKTAKEFRCDGYTDLSSVPVASYWLGLARANAVCNLLHSSGVRAKSSIVSYGNSKPLVRNGTLSQRAVNRRVVVTFVR